MKITKIGISRGRKLNLGNYETADVSHWIEVEIDGEDEYNQAMAISLSKINEFLEIETEMILGRKTAEKSLISPDSDEPEEGETITNLPF